MKDRFDAVLGDEATEQRLVAGVAHDERYALGDGPRQSGGEVVEDHDALAGIGEFKHHVAADIASSAGN